MSAIDTQVVPATRDLGDGFKVRRALPSIKRRMVGPFVFLDEMGPVQLAPGAGLDVRPHPHIGLATVTIFSTARSCTRTASACASRFAPATSTG
jgi:hypothetical protein